MDQIIEDKLDKIKEKNESRDKAILELNRLLLDLNPKLIKENELNVLIQKLIEENLILNKKIELLVSMIWDIRQQLLYMAPERPALDRPSLKKYQHSLDKSFKDMKNLNNNNKENK